MASSSAKTRRPQPDTGEEPELKRPKPQSESPLCVALNPADCNLDFDVGENGLKGHALHQNGFAYCWSGARATVGVTRGKYCFGCKVVSEQTVDLEDTPPEQRHLCRVGISRGDDPVGNLGESDHSFGFGGTGKFSTAGRFSDYGGKFGVGDVIVCAVDLEEKPLASIGFSKNGQWLGNAKKFDVGPSGLKVADTTTSKLPWASALFPHVLLKNVVVQMQFSIEDGLLPVEGYKPWSAVIKDGIAVPGPVLTKPKDCEVLMMVGLPASGKSTWAEKWSKEHPEKRYVLLGTNLALDQMKVPGLMRKQNYGERFDRLMDRATGIFNTLLSRASKTPRNYILDQTNVYKSARKRKLREFADYRKVAVVVFPTQDELRNRAEKRFKEMGKEVPAEAVNEMLANYVLPTGKGMSGSDEFFDEVIFTESDRAEAQKYLEEMKRVLRSTPRSAGKESSPYSRQSSVQSFSSPPLVPKTLNKEFSDSGGRPSFPDDDFRSPLANRPVPLSGSYGTSEYSSRPYNSSIGGSSLDHGRSTSTQRDGQDSYGPHSGIDYYRSGSQRTLFTRSEMAAYGRTGLDDPLVHPNFGTPTSIGRYEHRDPRNVLPDMSCNVPSGGQRMHLGGTGGQRYLPFDRYSSPSGTPISYGGPGPYEGSRIPQADFPPPVDFAYAQQPRMSSTYGSYRNPPLNSYGNHIQPDQWQSPRYPSGSWQR